MCEPQENEVNILFLKAMRHKEVCPSTRCELLLLQKPAKIIAAESINYTIQKIEEKGVIDGVTAMSIKGFANEFYENRQLSNSVTNSIIFSLQMKASSDNPCSFSSSLNAKNIVVRACAHELCQPI